MKAFVINLDRTPQRWQEMSAKAEQASIAIERVPAVDGLQIDAESARAWQAKSFLGHQLTSGELACFFSHRLVWQRIAASEERYGAVFEDDVEFGGGISEFLGGEGWIPEDADIVRLETFYRMVSYNRRPHARFAGRDIFRVRSSDFGAAGYIISKECCRRLVTDIETVGDPVDEMIFNARSPLFGQLRIYQVAPALCVQKTTMGAAGTETSTLSAMRSAYRRRGWHKIRHEAARILHQCAGLPKAVERALSGTSRKTVPFE